MSVVINAGAISEALNDKLDRNRKNAASPCSIVIKDLDGASGYRIWSNGYCKQWGFYTGNTWNGGAGVVITFLKKFKDTNYYGNVVLRGKSVTVGEAPNASGHTYNPTVSSMVTANYQSYDYALGYYWEASDHLAEGQY